MKYTENYQLHLPEGHDPVSRVPLNENMGIIDQTLHLLAQTEWSGGNMWRAYVWAARTNGVKKRFYAYGTDTASDPFFEVLSADKVSLANDGAISLVDPTTHSCRWPSSTDEGSWQIDLSDAAYENRFQYLAPGKYIQVRSVNNGVNYGDWSEICQVKDHVMLYWTTESTTEGNLSYSFSLDEYAGNIEAVVAYEKFRDIVTGESTDSYPADGWIDGVHYLKAAAAALFAPRVEMGSYTGTGDYGEANPTTLQFSIKPYLVFVQPEDEDGEGYTGKPLVRGLKSAQLCEGDSTETSFEWGTYSLDMYSTSSACQLNATGKKYNYLAIGHAE